jgi:hypothetical protein
MEAISEHVTQALLVLQELHNRALIGDATLAAADIEQSLVPVVTRLIAIGECAAAKKV